MILSTIIASIVKNKVIRKSTIVIGTGVIVFSFIYKTIKDPAFLTILREENSIGILISTIIVLLSVLSIPKFLTNESLKSDDVIDKKLYFLSKRLGYLKSYQNKEKPLSQLEVAARSMSVLEKTIQSHIGKLQRNSIVNLMIGIIGTLISVGILTTSILSQNNYKDVQEFLLAFVPKLSFVVFIQLFAFFFLRLYKGNLEDSKYFQNELTNMLSKSIAIKIAFQLNDSELIKSLVVDLSKTERNFKLAAGESLLNLEKTKIEKDFDLEMLNSFKDFLKANKKEG